jgi:hypothetical protein
VPPTFCRALLGLSFFATALAAQGTARDTVPRPAERAPISDNSFLVEEAYNQEAGVVQHISGFSRTSGSDGWAYSLTQEWPLGGQRHQLSYTVPLTRSGEPAATGLGDVMVNYRLQAVFDEARGIAVSPRVSWSFPTGDHQKGLGLGGGGLQVNLPISKTLGRSLVSHTNVGATSFSRAPGAGDSSTRQRNVFAGQSFIWLARPRFNLLVETVWTRTTTDSDSGSQAHESAFVVPGIRWGYDFRNGLQVIPGIGVPIGVGSSHGTRQLFLYLSLEHPFTATAK